MIARDWLTREEVELRFTCGGTHACKLVVDDGEHGARATIQSGIGAGIQEPHGDLKDRDSRTLRLKPNGAATDDVGIGVSLDDFVAYMPAHSYIFKPTGEMWAAASVNARLPRTKVGMDRRNAHLHLTSTWLDKYSPVEQLDLASGWPCS